MTKALGRFNHHPDPAIDFEIEVESLQSLVWDAEHNLVSFNGLPERITKAMDFVVGGDPSCIRAKDLLRLLDAGMRQRFPEIYQ